MNEPTINLYQAEWCSYCRKVRMSLTDLGITYTRVNVPRDKAKRGSALQGLRSARNPNSRTG